MDIARPISRLSGDIHHGTVHNFLRSESLPDESQLVSTTQDVIGEGQCRGMMEQPNDGQASGQGCLRFCYSLDQSG